MNLSIGQRDRGLGENTLRRGKPMGESDTPVLGELNQPKNSKISQRNKEITTKGSKELSMGSSCERGRNKSEGVSFTQGRS
jgi:hypothetical protein